MKATEASAYFWDNATKAVQDSSKGALTVHSDKKLLSRALNRQNILVEVIRSLGHYARSQLVVKLSLL